VRRRLLAGLGSFVFLLLAPGIVAGLVPFRMTRWRVLPPLLGFEGFRPAGVLLIAAGLLVLLESFWRFAARGLGTPAPVLPTRRLVVSGLYRYVRNPMYLAVVATIAGQALLLGSVRLLEYGALVWGAFSLFVLLYEEPTLEATYGAEYEAFRRNVPRWIPRLSPWRGPSSRRSELMEAVRRIAGEPGPREDRARRIAEAIRTSANFRWVGLYDVDAPRGLISNIAWSGPGPPAHPTFPIRNGLTGVAVAERSVVNVGDVARDPSYLATLASTLSEIIIPVFEGGVVVGTIDVESEEPDAFDAAAEAALRECATAAASLWRGVTRPEALRE